MNLPSTLDPETAAWMRLQMTIAAARAVEPLADQVRATEDFAYGLLRVLGDIMPALIEGDPALAAQLEPQWQQAAEQFERMERGEAVETRESADRLEARGQLYRLCTMRKAWPGAARQDSRTGHRRGAAR